MRVLRGDGAEMRRKRDHGKHTVQQTRQLAQRMLCETSFLNWSRNAVISSISGIGLYSVNLTSSKAEYSEQKRTKLEWQKRSGAKSMLALGTCFITFGTLQHTLNSIKLEKDLVFRRVTVLSSLSLCALYLVSIHFALKVLEEE